MTDFNLFYQILPQILADLILILMTKPEPLFPAYYKLKKQTNDIKRSAQQSLYKTMAQYYFALFIFLQPFLLLYLPCSFIALKCFFFVIISFIFFLYHNIVKNRDTVTAPLKELRLRSCILNKLAKLFKIVISNPSQSSPSSAILAPFCCSKTPLLFFFLSKPSFLGFATL